MSNHPIALITDSTCDIPEILLQQYNITVIPELVIWGKESLRDRVDITPKAFYRLLERFFEQLDASRPMRIAVLHGNAPAEARTLAECIRQTYSPVELLVNITGPVLGINTGPRALALCGYTE